MRMTPHSRMKENMALVLVNREKHSANKKKSTFTNYDNMSSSCQNLSVEADLILSGWGGED